MFSTLFDRLPIPDVVAFVRSLPWPDPVQRSARCGISLLASVVPQVAELLVPPASAVDERRPAPSRMEPTRPALDGLTELRAPEWERRVAGARSLLGKSAPRVISSLAGALRDPSVEVAVQAAESLGAAGTPAARAALLVLLREGPGALSPNTRAAALRALGTWRAEEPDACVVAAVRDLDVDVSLAAIETLAAHGGVLAAATLRDVAEDASGYFLAETRLRAAEGLARCPRSGPDDPSTRQGA